MEYKQHTYPTQAMVAIRPPKPTISLIVSWLCVVLAEMIAGFYALHIYAHML